MAPEATRRAYTSRLRSEQAADTRRRVLDAAAHRFAADGYVATTLAGIAGRAGVSVETVKSCGAKRDLLLSSFEQTFAGEEGTTPLSSRPGLAELLTLERDADAIAASVAFVAEANARASTLWRTLTSAADTDPVIRASLTELLGRRRADITAATAVLQNRGLVPRGPDARARTADVLSFLSSPEGYEQLVLTAGWPHRDYVDWLTRTITAALLHG
ncbi:TetR family transcriptional regulator [Amycolatopsis antarctica]|uniref:TetR family transcriptional regulator n=1 Tax=Amycolatopsis antarctica TaxID=1854586 RepID=A0A263D6P3_9PSEU|nr:TetR/AcrR family transcriptional regulator [Amycolatopsis antarctica]OZM73085.1 TetR family transcriptional regulator [Amycolatopsis antarctica]